MTRIIRHLALSGLAALVAVPWSYAADTGESLCTIGRSQSPIAIDTAAASPSQLSTPAPSYHPSGVVTWSKQSEKYETFYALFTASVGAPGPNDNTLLVDGVNFRLVELHFHRPGEHPIDGRVSAMELHLVHSDGAGNLAVLAVPIEVGGDGTPDQPTIAQLWRSMPQKGDERRLLPEYFDPSGFLPASRIAYRYPGSLTTGGCDQIVRWTVFSEKLVISPAQARQYNAIFKNDNSRSVQAPNGRIPLRSVPD